MAGERKCYVCPEPVEHPPTVERDPGDWLCAEHAADERRLARYAGEAGHCPYCDPGWFYDVGRACLLHARATS